MSVQRGCNCKTSSSSLLCRGLWFDCRLRSTRLRIGSTALCTLRSGGRDGCSNNTFVRVYTVYKSKLLETKGLIMLSIYSYFSIHTGIWKTRILSAKLNTLLHSKRETTSCCTAEHTQTTESPMRRRSGLRPDGGRWLRDWSISGAGRNGLRLLLLRRGCVHVRELRSEFRDARVCGALLQVVSVRLDDGGQHQQLGGLLGDGGLRLGGRGRCLLRVARWLALLAQ